TEYRAPYWEPRSPCEWTLWERGRLLWQSMRYQIRRFWLWIVSYRPTVLVFSDTSLSVFFGENVLRNAVMSDTIARMQRSILLAVDRVRDSIAFAVVNALNEEEAQN